MSTERWIRCALGHDHWGSAGAAGILVEHRSPTGAWVLLQHRAAWTHHGDTWSVPGGAIREDEDAVHAAFRELREESGLDLAGDVTVRGSYLDDHGGWSYTTVAATIGERVDVDDAALARAAVTTHGRHEQERLAWVARDDVAGLPLHPGFAETWATVALLLEPPLAQPNG